MTSQRSSWYDDVRDYTIRLMRIRSVSPGQGENDVAREALRILTEGGLGGAYTASGLDPIAGDPHGRANAYAFVRGASPRSIVLLGHIDTVATEDYGALEPYALDPDALATRLDTLASMTPGLQADLEAHPGDWLFGRGAADMKSGVAINLALMRHFATLAQKGELPLSVVLLATPDEENESAGVLQGVHFLLRLREQHDLDYLGAINTDYVTALYPGDPHRYIYTGSIGKLLPSFLIVGKESHVGDPFDGLDANLIAAELIGDLSMADDLCDSVRGQVTAPPVTLHATDLKAHYDVQLPFMAHFYLNVLTFTSTPADILALLRARCEVALARVLQRIDAAERRWIAAQGDPTRASQVKPRTGAVLDYATLRAEVVSRLGEAAVTSALDAEWDACPPSADSRDRCLRLVRRLWVLSGRQGPAVVLYFSPPYYPHVSSPPSPLQEAVSSVVAVHPDLNLAIGEYFPLLSDMSYLRLDPGVDTAALVANMPVWRDPAPDAQLSAPPGAYTLPFAAMRSLDLSVIDLGVYGKGAHQRGERVLMSYSFGDVPQLIYETIMCLAEITGPGVP
ncbi:MAG: M20/M25/M40 family metallo-hydrolase [Ktedonobacterales bacterium]